MQFSAVTLTLFAGVAILFVAGAGLIWIGFKRDPDRLPEGAGEVLDALASGHLAPPPRKVPVDEGAVRLVERGASSRAPGPDAPARSSTSPGEQDDPDSEAERFFAQEPELQRF